MSAMDFAAKLGALLRARYPLVYIVTAEETRALFEIRNAAAKRKYRTASWAITTGWTDATEGTPLRPSDEGDPDAAIAHVLTGMGDAFTHGLFVLRDLDPYLDDPRVVRRLRDCANDLRRRTQTVCILSPVLKIPPHLTAAVAVLEFPLPDRAALEKVIDDGIADIRESALAEKNTDPTPTSEVRSEVLALLSGLALHEAEGIVAKSLATRVALDPAFIAAEKKAAIRKTEVLEIIDTPETLDDVGGHERLKQWLLEAHASLSDEAKAFGVEPVRGGLLVGVPGAGKSLVAKAAANTWRLPLIRVDIGRLMGGIVGESESRARQLTQILDASAPVLAWADEIEKGIGGVASSAFSDSGTTARVFGHLLTWIQETTKPVVLLATANNAALLPPEFLRRFDAIWWFDPPEPTEREQIWTIHLRKRRRDPAAFDITRLVRDSGGYTGAEIEKAIKQALRRTFLDGRRELQTDDLLTTLRAANPLAVTNKAQIAQARSALNGLAMPTHLDAPAPESIVPSGRRIELERDEGTP